MPIIAKECFNKDTNIVNYQNVSIATKNLHSTKIPSLSCTKNEDFPWELDLTLTLVNANHVFTSIVL